MINNQKIKSSKSDFLLMILVLTSLVGCKTESQNNDSMVGYTQELAKKQSELSAKSYIEHHSESFHVKIDDNQNTAASGVVDLDYEKNAK